MSWLLKQENQQLIGLENLTHSDMDINEFILLNFVSQKNDQFEVNYSSIEKALPQLQLIQQQTCEEIALSVDSNLDQYIDISEKLSSLRETLSNISTRYSSVESDLEITKESMLEKIYQINAIMQNLGLINQLDQNMNILKKLLRKIERLQTKVEQITSNEPSSITLSFSYQLIEVRDLYQGQVDTCVTCRQLCSRFNIIEQINNLQLRLQSYLEKQCLDLLTTKTDTNTLAIVIQSFIVLELKHLPEKIIIQNLLKPRLDQYYDELLKNKTALFKNESILEKFIAQILDTQEQQGVYVEEALSLIPKCPFKFKTMLMELVYIYLSQKECSFVYSVGVPDTFHRNYHALLNLRQKLNPECSFESEKKFNDKWNLNSYFSLRYNQIVRSYEQSMDEQLKSIKRYVENASAAPQITFKNVLDKHIKMCISKNIFIKSISSKFVRLIFQLVARFEVQINDLKNLMNEDHQAVSNDIAVDLCECWKNIPDTLQDLQRIFPQTIQLQDELKSRLFNLTSQFIDLTIIPLTNLCFQNLEPFNGIPAKFRMNNKDMPTAPSNFTGNTLRPLQNFLSKTTLHKSVQELLTTKVSTQVLQRFTQIKENVLEGCSKQEQLKQKLGVKKDTTSDFEKIQRQFELDEEELQRLVQSLKN